MNVTETSRCLGVRARARAIHQPTELKYDCMTALNNIKPYRETETRDGRVHAHTAHTHTHAVEESRHFGINEIKHNCMYIYDYNQRNLGGDGD